LSLSYSFFFFSFFSYGREAAAAARPGSLPFLPFFFFSEEEEGALLFFFSSTVNSFFFELKRKTSPPGWALYPLHPLPLFFLSTGVGAKGKRSFPLSLSFLLRRDETRTGEKVRSLTSSPLF